MEELVFTPAYQLAAAIRHRQVSASEVLEAHLEQIARHNPKLNAIITLNEEEARKQAQAADEAIDQDRLWGPLHGVPFTLKDVHDTAGLRSTMGATHLADRIPAEDSDVAARLKASGGILLGKTNAALSPDNPFGKTKNPWDLERTPGGSSSGSVAAIAAGLSPLDIGSDANGSILAPSHYSGIFGMRPTEHRVPNGWFPTDVHPLWRNLLVLGPMARSVEDLSIALRVIAGPSRRESLVPPVPWRNLPHLTLAGLKIAWTASFPGTPIAEDIVTGIEYLVQKLAHKGAQVRQCLPQVDLAAQSRMANRFFFTIIGAYETPPSSLGDYFTVLHERESFIERWEDFLSDWDAFLCPVWFFTAPKYGFAPEIPEDAIRPIALSSVTGQPAVVIPLGKDRDGLPVGVQLIGRRWEDERLLAIADRVADLTGGYQRPPGY